MNNMFGLEMDQLAKIKVTGAQKPHGKGSRCGHRPS